MNTKPILVAKLKILTNVINIKMYENVFAICYFNLQNNIRTKIKILDHT